MKECHFIIVPHPYTIHRPIAVTNTMKCVCDLETFIIIMNDSSNSSIYAFHYLAAYSHQLPPTAPPTPFFLSHNLSSTVEYIGIYARIASAAA